MLDKSLKELDKEAAKISFKSDISRCIEWNFLWSALFLNKKFETFDLHTKLMDLNMKALYDYSTKRDENNQYYFGFLSLACEVYKCQFGSLM